MLANAAEAGAPLHGRAATVRLGIIGCGAIAESTHLPAALSSSAVDPTVLCDTDAARRRFLQRKYGLGAIASTHYREAVQRVDAVILTLPNNLHAPLIEGNGVPVAPLGDCGP